jgi:serine/threonine-protein kinase
MELLEGESLAQRLLRTGPLTPADVVRFMSQALEGLGAAHAMGVVHRDLKPANLFVRRVGDTESLVILDFGVAKSWNAAFEVGLRQTTQHVLVGSPAFMAPEQLAKGGVVDARTDLWALGCTMQLLLTGRPPFEAGDLLETAHRIRHRPPAPLPTTIDPRLRRCIERCLAKEPSLRYHTAEALREALLHRPARRRPLAALGALALVAAVLLLREERSAAAAMAPPPIAASPQPPNAGCPSASARYRAKTSDMPASEAG